MNQFSPDTSHRRETLSQPKDLFLDKMIDWDLDTSSDPGEIVPVIVWNEQLLTQLDFSTLDFDSQATLQEILDRLQQQFRSNLENLGVLKPDFSAETGLVSIATKIFTKVRQVFRKKQSYQSVDDLPENIYGEIQAEFDLIKQKLQLLSPWFTADGQSIEITRDGVTKTFMPEGVIWRPERLDPNAHRTDADRINSALQAKSKEERDALKQELMELAQKIKDGVVSYEDEAVVKELARLRKQFVLPSSHRDMRRESEDADVQVPRYIEGPELGTGGAASVVLVFDMVKGDFFAAKKMRLPKGDPDTDFFQGLLSSEAKTLAAIKDTPGLDAYTPQVYDIFISDESEIIMIMEYLPDYKDPAYLLKKLRLREQDIKTEEQKTKKRSFTKTYITETGFVVDQLRQLVLHNDIKPANFLANEQGNVQVVDFGVASSIDDSGEGLFGTPAYMSPDRFMETTVDKKPKVELLNDCFALSAMFFRIVVEKRLLPASIEVWELLSTVVEMQTKPGNAHVATIQARLESSLSFLGLDPTQVAETTQIMAAGLGLAGTTFTWDSAEAFTKDLVKHF